jgi:type VI secretion system ImpC/EvpB family protein
MHANPNLASAVQALGSGDSGQSALLDAVIRKPVPDEERAGTGMLAAFLAEERVGEALRLWLGEPPRDDERYNTAEAVASRLTADIAAIDALLAAQVNAILHHPRFQQLEASWRGIAFLVRRADIEGEAMVKVKILSVSWRELEKDFERAVEFDQSQVFKKVYEQEFGSPGGEPFGIMIGDYSVSHRVSRTQPTDDIAVLRSLAGVAASSFCPFLCAAKAELLDLESFSELQVTRDHAARLSMKDYIKWNALRSDEDARFLGILLPRILMRGPYQDDGSRVDRFIFDEDYQNPDGGGYLWGNPAYAYAAVAIRAFATSGWLADVRGLRQDEDGGGLVSDLPSLSFPTDSAGVIPLPVTDVTISDSLERKLSDLGLVPLCDCKDTPLAVFASGQSLQKPKSYNDSAASANARISAMLPYILTVSRFAHYVKVIGRSRTGSFASAEEIERHLHDWVMDYVSPDREASTDIKARRPLREASITVQPDPGMPGSFHCVMRLAPHYELDEVVGSVRLTTTIRGS